MWALPGFVSGAKSSFLIGSSLIGLVILVNKKFIHNLREIVGLRIMIYFPQVEDKNQGNDCFE